MKAAVEEELLEYTEHMELVDLRVHLAKLMVLLDLLELMERF